MQYLIFESSEGADGIVTLDAVASISAARHADAMAEVEQVLDWARRNFPHGHGPVEDGHDWDHDLQLSVEDGRRHVVTLTLTGSPRFVDAFLAAHESARMDGLG